MTEQRHTPSKGFLRIDKDNSDGIEIVDDRGNLVCVEHWGDIPSELSPGRAEQLIEQTRAYFYRIVACWNFCINKETGLLEAAIDYNEAHDDAGWEEPHPIFMMAQERDSLLEQNKELEQQITDLRFVIAKAGQFLVDRFVSGEGWSDEKAGTVYAALLKSLSKATILSKTGEKS